MYKNNALSSTPLIELAQVYYHGEEANSAQKQLTAEDIGIIFKDDASVDMYGYSTQYEDMAMLFETTMMKYHYDIDRDIGFIQKPSEDINATYKDYIVSWGKRNKLADRQVSDRALLVVNAVLPNETDWNDFFANKVGSSELLQEGKNWYDSRKLNVLSEEP